VGIESLKGDCEVRRGGFKGLWKTVQIEASVCVEGE
jgi:hypothetical protein